jgi:hypothetical protein
MVGATLGLLAFLLAFVMSIATNRFDDRRQLVVEEATAIHTAYLQAGYLKEPYSGEIRTLVSEYVGLRIASDNMADVQENVVRSEEIQMEVWGLTEEMVKADPGRDEIAVFIESVNNLINVHTRRSMVAFTSRLPVTLVYGMYLMAALSMAMVGVQNSYSGKRNYFSIIALILVFTIVIMLIIDLDRPQEGLLRVNQQALIHVKELITSPNP